MSEPETTVLIVDDESHVRSILRTLLERMDFQIVAEGKNGLDAVELFNLHEPDLMLLDINMPVMTGEEALMILMPSRPDARVIMLTSMTDVRSVETCIELGAMDYIRKDTSLDEIQTTIKAALAREA